MKTNPIFTLAVLVAGSYLALLAAQEPQGKTGRTGVAAAPAAGRTRGAPARETITVAADEPIPNVPGKRLVSHVVDYPPGGRSAPHHHARSAFVYAYVVSGQVRSQVNGVCTPAAAIMLEAFRISPNFSSNFVHRLHLGACDRCRLSSTGRQRSDASLQPAEGDR